MRKRTEEGAGDAPTYQPTETRTSATQDAPDDRGLRRGLRLSRRREHDEGVFCLDEGTGLLELHSCHRRRLLE